MALTCITGLRECDGCGMCRRRRCYICREEIMYNEKRLVLGDIWICADCLSPTYGECRACGGVFSLEGDDVD